MTIKDTPNNNVASINNYYRHDMAVLKKLLASHDIKQNNLANLLHKDNTTVNRWVKNSRNIAWSDAEKIAEILNVHPSEIYIDFKKIRIEKYMSVDYEVKHFEHREVKECTVPFCFFTPDTFAIQINAPGYHSHGEVQLFDLPGKNEMRFNELSINKMCYVTFSKKKKQELKLPQNYSVVGVIKEEMGTFKILLPRTFAKVKEFTKNLLIEDIDLVLPVKAKYYPKLMTVTKDL